MTIWNGIDYHNSKTLFSNRLYLPFQKGLKVQQRFRNLSSTQNEIQSFSLHQLKWNLRHKHNDDMRIITLSNRGISFQFWLRVRSFFVTHSRHFSFVFQFYSQFNRVAKQELATCFSYVTLEYIYLYKKEKMKGRKFIPHRSPISRLSTINKFLVHFQNQKFQPYTLRVAR